MTLIDRNLGPDEVLAVPSALEAENIALVREFLSLADPAERVNYVTGDFRLNRVGMQNLCDLAGIPEAGPGPHAGYDEDSFADRRNEIIDIMAKDAAVWVVFRLVGTHTGKFWGMAATGAPLDLLELGVFRVAGKRIAEAWFMNDELAICRQLGIPVGVPSLSSAE